MRLIILFLLFVINGCNSDTDEYAFVIEEQVIGFCCTNTNGYYVHSDNKLYSYSVPFDVDFSLLRRASVPNADFLNSIEISSSYLQELSDEGSGLIKSAKETLDSQTVHNANTANLCSSARSIQVYYLSLNGKSELPKLLYSTGTYGEYASSDDSISNVVNYMIDKSVEYGNAPPYDCE